MPKIRVGQLAKELNLKTGDVIELLRKLGADVKNNLSTVDDEVARRARESAPSAGTAPPAARKPKAGAPKPPATAIPTVKTPAATATRAEGPVQDRGAVAGSTPKAKPQPTSAGRVLPTQPEATPAISRPPAARVFPGQVQSRPTAAVPQVRQGTASRPSQAGAPASSLLRPGSSSPAPLNRPPVSAARPGIAGAKPATGSFQRPQVPMGSGRPTALRTTPGSVVPRPPTPQGIPRPVSHPGAQTPRPGAIPSRPGAAAPPQAGRPPVPIGSRPATVTRPHSPAGAPRPAAPQPSRRPEPAPAGKPAPRLTRPEAAAPAPPAPPVVPDVLKEIAITEGATVKELSEKMDRKAKDIITRLIARGILATINQPLDTKIAQDICREFGFDAKVVTFEEEVAREEAVEARPANLKSRHPVVTIMGHVDHGKTSLLDAIRESDIVAGEAGGITQHIGAYHIRHKNRGITFIDTPGHEAFTMMRARGARVTDIVVLVVAADDGVMPQTVEAIDHARAAGVPLVVAINKVDKPGANLDRVKKQLSDHSLLVEDWGGDVVAVPISAKQKTGINELLEMILLVADIADVKADPTSFASGTVLESRLDKSRGPVATVLVQRGTLRIGDPFIAGAIHGKVRAMFDDLGHRVREAGPSIPIEVLGLEGVPRAGDPFQVLEEEWKVRQIGAFRQQKLRQEAMAKSSRLTLDHLYVQIKEGMVKELPLVVKADVQGSVEALTKTLNDLPSDRVKIKVIHAGTGAITESDVLLASASNAIIIGFNVRPERGGVEMAEKEKVDIRLHSIIYDVSNEIRSAMVGMLEPESKEVYLGRAEVRQVFKVPKVGAVAGCLVSDGRILRTAEVRLLRDNVVVYTGKVSSLRRFKDDAGEVKAGYECGIGLANFNDIKLGDVIEAFKVEKIAAKSL
jgi:translation initiation factor IF-2